MVVELAGGGTGAVVGIGLNVSQTRGELPGPGATSLALWKSRHDLGNAHLSAIAIGFVVSFIVALIVIRWFMAIVTRHGFAPFAWYRIVAGSIALAALAWH